MLDFSEDATIRDLTIVRSIIQIVCCIFLIYLVFKYAFMWSSFLNTLHARFKFNLFFHKSFCFLAFGSVAMTCIITCVKRSAQLYNLTLKDKNCSHEYMLLMIS